MIPKLLLAVLLMGTSISSTFQVEKLTDGEVKDLSTARQEFAAAQSKLEALETRIKEAHGQSKPTNWTNASCMQGSTTVELSGDYALITSESHNVCGAGILNFTTK